MSVNLHTEHHLDLLSLKGGCTGWSRSTLSLATMPHCWKLIFMIWIAGPMLKCCDISWKLISATSGHQNHTGRRQSKTLIPSTKADQVSLETLISITICRRSGDKWQSKTMFLTIFDLRSSMIFKGHFTYTPKPNPKKYNALKPMRAFAYTPKPKPNQNRTPNRKHAWVGFYIFRFGDRILANTTGLQSINLIISAYTQPRALHMEVMDGLPSKTILVHNVERLSVFNYKTAVFVGQSPERR